MIDALRHLDNRVALGLLARAALSLDGLDNPAAQAILDDETILRQKILAAARARVGLSPDDNSPDALEKIGDVLDQEADGLVGPSDMEAALRRLAEGGSLPTDMYEIQVNPAIHDWIGQHYELEKELLEVTIRHPDQEQHFAHTTSPTEPALVSLFFRRFNTKWPFKDFGVLVVASRNGLSLEVSQAWRIYPALLDTRRSTSLVDALRMFANHYGSRVEWEGETGSFFLTVGKPLPSVFTYQMNARPNEKRQIAIAQIVQHRGRQVAASLAVVIDLLRYKADLNRMQISRDQIIDNLVGRTTLDRVAS